MKRILIVRLSALGDVIFALPILGVLRRIYPDAVMSWLVEDKAANLLQHRNDLSRLLVYPRKVFRAAVRNPLKWPYLVWLMGKHIRTLRSEKYDLILDLQGNLKSGIHVLLARGGRKIGFAGKYVKECNTLFTQEHVDIPARAKHRIEKNVSLVKPDYEASLIERPDLQLPSHLVKEAEESIQGLFDGGHPLMVIHPGTSAFGAFKRWAPEKFGRLASRLHRERGFDTLVIWGSDEKELAEEVAETGGEGVIVAPPTRTLLHLAAYIRQGRVYVSADSGPLHLANYLGVPTVALFGPKDPALYRPYFPPSRVARSDVECGPCSKRQCDDPICMQRLEMDEVYNVLCSLLDEVKSTEGGGL